MYYDSSVSNSARLFVLGLVHQSVRALPNLADDLEPLENSIRDTCMPSNGEQGASLVCRAPSLLGFFAIAYH